MSITISGTLDRAEYRTTLEGRAALILTVAVPRGLPWEVRRVYGIEPFDHCYIRDRARLMRRGAPVTARAVGAQYRADHGQAVICAMGESDVCVDGEALT